MAKQHSKQHSRRQFLNTAVLGSAAAITLPTIVTAKKTDSPLIVGVGEHQYEVQHMWPQLPKQFAWQTTHNVAFDSEGLLYVIQEGVMPKKTVNSEAGKSVGNPTIFVFDADGKYIRSFGEQFIGGGHGLEIRNEAGQDFLYVCAYQQQRSIAKLDTKGEQVWRKGAPIESRFYAEGEEKFSRTDNPWGRDRFLPTNIAFLPDGGFFVADGYGAYRIHRYDQAANWVSSFGEPATKAKADGTFSLPHGIWIDDRSAEPLVVVADRVLSRLQWFTLDGEHRKTLDGFLLPANIDIYGDVLLVPDLVGRVTLLDKENKVLTHLGENSARVKEDFKEHGHYDLRSHEEKWTNGKFIHPHDACFDKKGNIFVAEWVQRGRVTKLRHLK